MDASHTTQQHHGRHIHWAISVVARGGSGATFTDRSRTDIRDEHTTWAVPHIPRPGNRDRTLRYHSPSDTHGHRPRPGGSERSNRNVDLSDPRTSSDRSSLRPKWPCRTGENASDSGYTLLTSLQPSVTRTTSQGATRADMHNAPVLAGAVSCRAGDVSRELDATKPQFGRLVQRAARRSSWRRCQCAGPKGEHDEVAQRGCTSTRRISVGEMSDKSVRLLRPAASGSISEDVGAGLCSRVAWCRPCRARR